MGHPAGDAAAGAHASHDRLSDPRWRPLTEGAGLILPLALGGMVARRWFRPAAPIALAVAGGIALAFRDPERTLTPRPDAALSPADGRVIALRRVLDEYWQTEMTEIAIFLALWDVHVQRAPMDGEIMEQRRKAGGYRPAMTAEATHGNNQLATYLQTAAGPCTVTQISGMVARRIVTWAAPGDHLAQGERLGMIKFGSQVTLRLPVSVFVLVGEGDHVRGGVTPLAHLAATPK